MSKAAGATKPGAAFAHHDQTLEEGLRSLAAILASPRCASDCRASIALGADLEFRIVVRQHHEAARGFCVSLNKYMTTPAVQIAWRTELK